MGFPTAPCVVCGKVYVPDPYAIGVWCTAEHQPGQCCHIGCLRVEDDGTHRRPKLSPYCCPVDV